MKKLKKILTCSALLGSLFLNGDLEKTGLEQKIERLSKTKNVEMAQGIEEYRQDLFSRLKPEISSVISKYPFNIKGDYGGNWTVYTPLGIKTWDDESDLDKIEIKGVTVGENSDQRVITHEYFHGIWDTFGPYSSREDRRIDKDQFRKDTENFIKDQSLKRTYLQEKFKKDWGVNESTPELMKNLIKTFPDDFKEGDIIPQTLTERFASLSEEYFSNKESLPSYLSRHFEIFYK